MSRRIVFLDIDGVLNNRDYLCSAQQRWVVDAHRNVIDTEMIDPVRVALVNEIVARTGAEIVISSSWRRMFKLPELCGILAQRGLAASVVGATPTNISRTSPHRTLPEEEQVRRGEEIQAWLNDARGVESFVILDDDSDMAHLADRHIKTDFEVGIDREHVERAVAMLVSP